MIEHRVFPNRPSSVAEARHYASEAASWLTGETSSVLALLVSEVATNAIRHARRGFTLTIERVDDAVRVEVNDTGPGTPEVLNPAVDEPSGRGLRIVEALADEWGVEHRPDGKTVWFVLHADHGLQTLAPGQGARMRRTNRSS